MFIPGLIISILTFPGVIIHELAHKLFCDWTGTRVFQVCYFRFGNPAGFVLHERPTNVWKHILIGIGPLFVNSALGLAVGILALPARENDRLFVLLAWVAISIAMHSFPSTGDARSIWGALWHDRAPFAARLAGTPLVALIFVGAIASMFWLDFFYGLGIAVALPEFLLRVIAAHPLLRIAP